MENQNRVQQNSNRPFKPSMSPIHDLPAEVPTLPWRILLKLIGALPERAMSRAFGKITDLPVPAILRPAVYRAFATAVGIDLSEVELPLRDYPNLNAFFVRRLRAGTRAWPVESDRFASPVDGIVGQFGKISAGRAIQAKGHAYSVERLLGDVERARAFADGSFLTIYLSPSHYHRIHTPAAGRIPHATHLPGALYPVNRAAVSHIPDLFVLNERLICYLEAGAQSCALVAVGAYNVGRISAAFDPHWPGAGDAGWITNQVDPVPGQKSYDPPIEIDAGDELMAFHLGSTIVLLFDRTIQLDERLQSGNQVQVGDVVAGPPDGS